MLDPSENIVFHPESTSYRGFHEDERCRFRPLKSDGIRVVIRLTYRCDLTCSHCLAGYIRQRELNFNEWQQVLGELPDIKARKVLLTGGEPLLHHDLVPITSFISQMGIPVDLNSNMYRMTRETMHELYDAGLTEMSVALDGPGEVHDVVRSKPGAFERVMQAIQWATELGIKVDASCCLTVENYQSIAALLEIVKTLPLQSFTFARFFPIGHGRNVPQRSLPQEILTEIYHNIKDKWAPNSAIPIRMVGLLGYPQTTHCGRGSSLIGITPSGSVLGCVLTDDNPENLPHPLEVGLTQAVHALREKLGQHHYKLCCDNAYVVSGNVEGP